MAKTCIVQARVDPLLDKKVKKILESLGISKSQAINMLFQQIELHRGIPFALKIPNAETLAAMEEAKAMSQKIKQGEKIKTYASFKEVLDELGINHD